MSQKAKSSMADWPEARQSFRREEAQRVAEELVQHAKLVVEKFFEEKGHPEDAVDAHCRELVRNNMEQVALLKNWLAILKRNDISAELRDLGNEYMALETTKDLRSELPPSQGGTMKWLNSKQCMEWLRNYEREHS